MRFKKEQVPTYWWSGAGNANFGDVLGPRLFEHFTDKKALWVPASQSELVIIGSIAEHLPRPYTGTIAGIGFGYRRSRIDLSQAKVLALRGELSYRSSYIRGYKPLLADPGLVAPDLINLNKKRITHEIGVIAHHTHRQEIEIPEGAMVIDITWPIEDVIEAASMCSAISSSSLHGIILADALHKPRQWVYFDRVQGGGYKFMDYFTSIGQKASPGQWKKAHKETILTKQEQLRGMLSCL